MHGIVKAVVYESYAPNDDYKSILKVKEIDEPKAKPNEVIIKVKEAASNYNDIWGMRGKPVPVPLPHISGSDIAGDVVEVGNEVQNLKIRDRVVSHSNLSCRVCQACTDGREFDCTNRMVWGFQTGPLWGGFCEMTHLPEVNVAKIPEGVSYDEAAAASMTLLTSWHMLVGRAKIRPGQVVLIMGGGSGVGTFGIEIAFDHIGQTHWNDQLTLLKYGGTLVTCGATTGYDAKTDLRHIFFKGTNILGSTQGTKAELEQGLYWMGKKKIKATIDSVYSFENAAEAHTKMLTGKGLVGKILLKP